MASISHPRAATKLQHHFDSPEQQADAATLGMWTFLVTEVMFFGGMFLAYILYRGMYHDAFASTSQFMNVRLGALNTGVLITSSLTMALAVRAAQKNDKRSLVRFLILTVLLGVVFLAIKGVEYHEKWVEHHIPGPGFSYAEAQYARPAQIFFYLYFAMTGMHAVHMIIGVGLLIYLWAMAARDRFSSAWYTPLEMVGLYWHFVDIIWIFLFPLLYLIGRNH